MAANTKNPVSHPDSNLAPKGWDDGLDEVCRLLAEYDQGRRPELRQLADEVWAPRLEEKKQANAANSEQR